MIRYAGGRWPLAIGLCLAATWAAANEAEDRLLAMAKLLAEADSFSVTIHSSYDAVQESGQQIEFSEVRDVVLHRPSRLRVEVHESDGDRGGLIFDGKTITQFNTTANVYARLEQPGDVDKTIRYTLGELRMRMPLGRLLRTTLPEELTRLNTRVDRVETNVLGPEPLEHIAGQTENVDYQVWLGQDNLPRRIVLTYRNAPGQPQFRARFSEWNMAPTISDSTFTFNPPEGAEEIPVVRRVSGVIP